MSEINEDYFDKSDFLILILIFILRFENLHFYLDLKKSI